MTIYKSVTKLRQINFGNLQLFLVEPEEGLKKNVYILYKECKPNISLLKIFTQIWVYTFKNLLLKI